MVGWIKNHMFMESEAQQSNGHGLPRFARSDGQGNFYIPQFQRLRVRASRLSPAAPSSWFWRRVLRLERGCCGLHTQLL